MRGSGKDRPKKGAKESAVLRIRDVYPGSEIIYPGSKVKKISDPASGSALKNLCIFNPKNCF
jgi:hypothetical protein